MTDRAARHAPTLIAVSVNGVVLGLGVDLDGSTFTAQKIENNVFPAPVLNCERVGVAESCK